MTLLSSIDIVDRLRIQTADVNMPSEFMKLRYTYGNNFYTLLTPKMS